MAETFSVLSCHAMYQYEIHIHDLQYLRNGEKNGTIMMLKVTSVQDMQCFFFSVYSEININSIEIQ